MYIKLANDVMLRNFKQFLLLYMYVHTQMLYLNSADPKTAPIGYFCVVVGNVNINMHLIENLFMEIVRPNIQ